MGRQQRDTAEIKRRLIVELDEARCGISHHASLAQEELNPAALVRKNVEKYRWAWIAGGAFAGVILIRVLFPPKFRSDKSGETATKRGVSAMALGLVFTLVRRAATNYATKHFREHAQHYIDSILNRRDPV